MRIAAVEAELAQLEKRASVLRKRLRTQRSKKLVELPALVGLRTMDALIAELAVHASSALRAHLKPYFATVDLSGDRLVTTAHHSGTNRMSPETKARVQAALQSGDKTSKLIAQENGVSVGTVNRMKHLLGLTRNAAGRHPQAGNGATP